tara:strand:- start:218 stop:439 length:222 start_codon:yes stop_codon:yes gene_type:complete
MSEQDDLEKLDEEQILMCYRALITTLVVRLPDEHPKRIAVKRCVRKLKKQYAALMDQESADEVFARVTEKLNL